MSIASDALTDMIVSRVKSPDRVSPFSMSVPRPKRGSLVVLKPRTSHGQLEHQQTQRTHTYEVREPNAYSSACQPAITKTEPLGERL